MRLRIVAGLVLALADVSMARAAEPAADAKFNIMGPSSCAGWPKSGNISSPAKAVPLNWALGFLSGAAAGSNLALLDLTDPEMVDCWLTTYCKDHPTDNLPLAVKTLQHELEAKVPPPAGPPPPPMFVPPAASAAPDAKPVPAKRAPTRKKSTQPAPKT
jgi:hypothetical protein